MAFQWHQICLRTFPLDFAVRRRKHFGCFTGCTQLCLKSSRTLFILPFIGFSFSLFLENVFRDCKRLETIFRQALARKCEKEKKLPHISTLEVFFLSTNSVELSLLAKKNSMNNLVFKNYENCATICVALSRKANFVWQIERWCNEKVHKLPETRWKHRQSRQHHVNGVAVGENEFRTALNKTEAFFPCFASIYKQNTLSRIWR